MTIKRFMLVLPCLLLLFAVTACGNDNQETFTPGSPVEAAFTMEPSEPVVRDTVTFAVTVTQDGKPVDDASEVKFEWWRDGQEPHEMLPATFQKDGLYIAKQTISQPGSYFVYYHVTARDFHTMKKIPFTVKGETGEVDQQATADENSNGQETKSSHEHEHGTEASESGQVELHFMPAPEIRASEETWLGVHIMHGDDVLPKATVRFEYWKDGEEKHAFLDASETHPGQYGAKLSFPASGAYTVKVHVEAGDIHDHKDFSVTVQ